MNQDAKSRNEEKQARKKERFTKVEISTCNRQRSLMHSVHVRTWLETEKPPACHEIAAVHTSISLVCVLPFLPISDVSRHLPRGRIIRSVSRYFALSSDFYHLRVLIVFRRKGEDFDLTVHPLLNISCNS